MFSFCVLCIVLFVIKNIAYGHFSWIHRGNYKGMTIVVKEIQRNAQRSEDEFWKGFAREADICYRVGDDPHIVPFVGICIDKDHPAMLFVLKQGGSVENVLCKQRKYWSEQVEDVRKVMRMAMEAAIGICYLHSKDVVHRDIACQNMLLNQDHHLWSHFILSLFLFLSFFNIFFVCLLIVVICFCFMVFHLSFDVFVFVFVFCV